MIPAFENTGNLPVGVHTATLEQIKETFGTNTKREWLYNNLTEIIKLAKSTGKLERVIIWGSFVSAKNFPNDIDLLILMSPDFVTDELPPNIKKVFNHEEGKLAFRADIFWAKTSMAYEILNTWIEGCQITREKDHRGIIEVTLND